MTPHLERIDPALIDWQDLLDHRPIVHGVDLVAILNHLYQDRGTASDLRADILRVLTGTTERAA